MLVYSTDQAGPNSQFCGKQQEHAQKQGQTTGTVSRTAAAARWTTRQVSAMEHTTFGSPRASPQTTCSSTAAAEWSAQPAAALMWLAAAAAAVVGALFKPHPLHLALLCVVDSLASETAPWSIVCCCVVTGRLLVWQPLHSFCARLLTGGFHLGFFRSLYLHNTAKKTSDRYDN